MFHKVENGVGLTITPPSGCSLGLFYSRRPRHHRQLFKLLSGFQKSRNLSATWSESAFLIIGDIQEIKEGGRNDNFAANWIALESAISPISFPLNTFLEGLTR